jgi:hypothetical protein
MTADIPSRTQLPNPSGRGGWLWLAGWVIAVGFVFWHASAVMTYLDRVSATRFSDETLVTPMQRVPQYIAPDGQMWIRESLAMVNNGDWRLRSSEIDNAPTGRPIYWNSGWAWWLVGCAKMRMFFTGEPLPAAMEVASAWANVPLFIAMLTFASGWVCRRWGGTAGALMALGLAGSRAFYGAFYPAYPDHHGLIAGCILGLVLGVVMAGGGWRRLEDTDASPILPDDDKTVIRAMTVSAIFGAIGMWVSAASLVVMIALTGCAGLVVGFAGSRVSQSTVVAVPGAWRHWGRVGAAISLGFYLLENVPDRLGMRMEANHPLYALAWWGAGEAITAVLLWNRQRSSVRPLLWSLMGWGAAVLVTPVVIWVRGAAVFAPVDPFLRRIHEAIHEFEPLSAAISRAGWPAFADTLGVIAAVVLLASLACLRRSSTAGARRVVICAGIVAAGAVLQGVWQNRWLLTAGGPLLVLAIAAVVVLASRFQRWQRAMLFLAVIAGICLPGPWILMRERRHVEQVRDVQMGETVQLLYRDIADALVKAGAGEKAVVLADPNTSVGVGYYGDLATVGTLYWENRDGLKAAADILCARDDAEAAALVHARGITHVALVSTNDFLAEYDHALTGVAPTEKKDALFGYRLLYEDRVPVWLRPLEYSVPAPLVPLGFKVVLFAVDFEASPAIAHERIGRHQFLQGKPGLAEASLMASLAADSTRPTPWLLEGRLLLSSGHLQEAYHFIRGGIERSPEADRAAMFKAAALLFSRAGDVGKSDALLQAATESGGP